VVGSENHPLLPEYPPDNPKFPATPTTPFKVPGLSNVWVKDESCNPTGTHKDRMAWEIVVTYRDFLLAKRSGKFTGPLPQMSIISSGCAATAIQTLLRRYKLPSLKVLVDHTYKPALLESLRELGCEIYKTDLTRKALHWKEILSLTQNPNGFDITSNDAMDPTTRFYDWLSYEILNESPDYCFVPFGTGNLFENILNIAKREVTSSLHDPRFVGSVETLRKCNYLGATTNDPSTLADKLYSPHLPFVHFDEQWIRIFKMAGFCGDKSNVHLVREEFLEQAIDLAEFNALRGEPSGLAGLALLLQMRDEIPADSKVLIVNTGSNKIFDA
ncbi:MAG: PLP-dependent lyase/thiolase, partial [Bdellovibrionales bacterium]|nr:PLP-dependent lyase/thiolase [Bdellovibrionales bacterium]